MKTKKLYVLVSDGGDGSSSVSYTMNSDLILEMKRAELEGRLDHYSIGCSGGSFDYDTLYIPAECTYQSLGIHFPADESIREILTESYAGDNDGN